MIILHIDSSITGETSVSRQLAGATVAKLTAARSDAKVRYRDLVATPMDHYVMADKPDNETQGSAFSASILDEFLMADTVVIGAPFTILQFQASSRHGLIGSSLAAPPLGWMHRGQSALLATSG